MLARKRTIGPARDAALVQHADRLVISAGPVQMKMRVEHAAQAGDLALELLEVWRK